MTAGTGMSIKESKLLTQLGRHNITPFLVQNSIAQIRTDGGERKGTHMKKKDKATKLELAANLVKALPESSEQTALAVAAAMLAGYNLGKMAAQGA